VTARARTLGIIAGAVLFLAGPAVRSARAQDACAGARSGLLPGGTTPADFATVADPCGASDLTVRARGAFLIAPEMPDYYGSIIADAMMRARRRITARSWLSFGLDLVTYRYVNNGGLASQGASFGPPTLGYHRTLYADGRRAVAGYARALLPLDSARFHGVETGLELGAGLRQALGSHVAPPRFVLLAGLSAALPVDIVAGQAHGRVEPGAAVELWFAAGTRLDLFGGGITRFAIAPEPAFITAVPRAGARLALSQRVWTSVLVELPVVGRDRTDLVASLFLGYSP
jgi:hypothetical protein